MILTSMPGRSFQGPLPPLTPAQAELAERLRVHVETLAGQIGERNLFRYAALQKAENYIATSFKLPSLETHSHRFTVDSKEVRNIGVEIAGTDLEAEVVVVGAHYDSVRGSPGANDNATGVAALLELAHFLADRAPRRTVRVVAFVNEEPPFFTTDAMGSVRDARQAAERGENIVAMLSLETIGYYSDEPGSQRYPFPFSHFYPETGNFIGFVGNLSSRSLVRRATESFRAHAAFPSEGLAAPGWLTGIGWSDHWSYWKAGFPAIMVTDTALFRYTQYHTAADRPEVVDYERFARVVEGLFSVVEDLAQDEAL